MPDKADDTEIYPAANRAPGPDAHGQAAFLLVESLILGLVERSVIRVNDALEIIDAAAEVKAEIAIDLGDPPETRDRSLALLTAIGDSLRGGF